MNDLFNLFLSQFILVYKKYMTTTQHQTLKEQFVELRTNSKYRVYGNKPIQLEFEFVKQIDDSYIAARYSVYKDKDGKWREI